MATFILMLILGGTLTFLGVFLTSVSAQATFNVFIWVAFMYVCAGLVVIIGIVDLIRSIVSSVVRHHRHEEFIRGRYPTAYGKSTGTRKTGRK